MLITGEKISQNTSNPLYGHYIFTSDLDSDKAFFQRNFLGPIAKKAAQAITPHIVSLKLNICRLMPSFYTKYVFKHVGTLLWTLPYGLVLVGVKA